MNWETEEDTPNPTGGFATNILSIRPLRGEFNENSKYTLKAYSRIINWCEKVISRDGDQCSKIVNVEKLNKELDAMRRHHSEIIDKSNLHRYGLA
jgi:hypothetical protein